MARNQLADAGVVSWLIIAASAVLLNAAFTSTLEGPQAAVWLWVVFGTGAFMADQSRRASPVQQSEVLDRSGSDGAVRA